MNDKQDKRPDPKPRKHAHLWQYYLIWDAYMQMRKRHTLRLSSIEAGKSNLDAEVERMVIADLDPVVTQYQKAMINYGAQLGPVWDWMTGIKGCGDHTAAKILALIDDIGKFETISKLWRFAGYAVIGGKREYNVAGEKSHYSRRLKSECFLLAEQFIMHQTPYYAELYYAYREDDRARHPEKIGGNGNGALQYNDKHMDMRAKRYITKRFLSHLWVVWRDSEGLPVSDPYAQAIMGHTHLDAPPVTVEA